MVLEATLVCVDNSEWMRNGDFIPNRLQAQQDAVNAVCRMKSKINVENTVGLMSLADNQVRVTLTTDVNKVLKALQVLEPKGKINFLSGLRIAHLALKHRQNKNQKIRIVAFVGSPVDADVKDLQKLARRLKKEKVNVDIVNFGEDEANTEKLSAFIDALNGKEKTCHLVTCRPGPMLSEAILTSPILSGEDGTPIAPGFEFGIDPSEDPELAMALRVSLEEQRQRQEQETSRVKQESLIEAQQGGGGGGGGAGSMEVVQTDLPYNPGFSGVAEVGPDNLTEEQQVAMAIQMSLQGAGVDVSMETGEAPVGKTEEVSKEEEDAEMEELMQNREYLQSVLRSLPGVNPEEALHNLEQMTQATQEHKPDEADKEDKDDPMNKQQRQK